MGIKHMRLWAASLIIAIIIIGGFILSVPHTHDVAQTSASKMETATSTVVTLHDSFKKGIHTITGSLEAPDACATVTANATTTATASSTQRIMVAITMPDDTGVCLQLPTKTDFSTKVAAPADLPISATVNGEEASTTGL